MWILVNWAMLVLATLIAGAAAVAFYWLLLRATVAMMRPATASVSAPRKIAGKE
jgi:di/tricarboxylate transporter